MFQIGTPLASSYDYRLVAVSIFSCISTSYAALDLGGRVTAAQNWTRSLWLYGGATAMGIGIWSMHFIGMLAFLLPVQSEYDWPTVLLSVLIAIASSAVALYVVSRKKMSQLQGLIAGVIMGMGIVGMHYVGMFAMRLPADIYFNPILVTASVLIGVFASWVAVKFTFNYREDFRGTTLGKFISAGVMGIGISSMHYVGMESATFFYSAKGLDLSHGVSISALGLTGIVLGALTVQAAAIVASTVDRNLAARAHELQTSERFRQIADNLPVVLALSNGDLTEILYVSRNYQEVWGQAVESLFARPRSILDGIHPKDRGYVEERVQRLLAGEPIEDLECRVIRPDGTTVWVSCRGYPIRDENGKIYRLVGSAQNITRQKNTEQDLQYLSGQLLRLQDEERRRIAGELHDSTGQDLVALATTLGQLRNSLPIIDRKSRDLFVECKTLTEKCIREIRTLSYVLHPTVLDQSGLADAIRDFVDGFTKRTGIRVNLELPPQLGRLARDIELTLYRVVQEALTNIQRHSGSQEATVLGLSILDSLMWQLRFLTTNNGTLSLMPAGDTFGRVGY